MKLSLLLLFLCCSFVYSHIQATQPMRFPRIAPLLNEEQKLLELRGLIPAVKFVKEIKAIYNEFVQIRKSIVKRVDETSQVIDMFSKIETTVVCKECQVFFNEMIKIADFKVVVNIVEKIAVDICERNLNRTVCEEAIYTFAEIAYSAIIDRALNPKHVCEMLAMCPHTTHTEKLADYVKEILKDKPETKYPTPSKKNTYTVLQLTDPHIDLKYQEGSNTMCDEPLCCRAESGYPKDQNSTAGFWGTYGACDLPMRTFDQFLKYTAKNFKVDMILWLGDNNAHDIWHQEEKTQLDNTYDATQKIMQYFPNASVYPMFGNHEPFPADQFDFISNTTSWLTSSLADMWKQWLDETAYNTFKDLSYYSTVNQKYNLKIISLDMLACDQSDFFLLRNPTDPNHQLEWLRKELYDAEARNLGVYILGHIPPGDYGCYSQWSARFRALVDRFTNIIRGQFFGHTHDDHFQVTRSYSDNSAVGVVFVSPSLTTFSNLLPSFRIYEMDAETNQPLNYHQFRLDLNKWNKHTNGDIEWDVVYNVIQEYNLEDMSFASFDKLADKILSDRDTAMTFLNNIYSGKTITEVSKRELQHYYCSAKNSVSEEAFRCLGLDATVGDLMSMAKQMLPGAWYYDKC